LLVLFRREAKVLVEQRLARLLEAEACTGPLAQRLDLFVRALLELGAAEAGRTPSGMSLISDLFPARLRGTALGIYYLGAGIGAAASAMIGAMVAARYGWRMAIVVAGLPGILLGFLVWFTLRDVRRGAYESRRVEDTAPPFLTVLRFMTSQRAVVVLIAGGDGLGRHGGHRRLAARAADAQPFDDARQCRACDRADLWFVLVARQPPRMRGLTTATAQVVTNLLGYGVGRFAVGALSTAIGGADSLRQGMALVCATTMALAALALVLGARSHASAAARCAAYRFDVPAEPADGAGQPDLLSRQN
jgi:MFS family permease